MTRSNHYETKQKDIIINCIKNHQEFSINEIYEELKGQVGLTTIYRKVDSLVEQNQVSKTIGNNNITYYQYLGHCDKDNHFFLRCEECGNIEHIDCDCIKELSDHITKNHKFSINKEKIVINGICNKCNNK